MWVMLWVIVRTLLEWVTHQSIWEMVASEDRICQPNLWERIWSSLTQGDLRGHVARLWFTVVAETSTVTESYCVRQCSVKVIQSFTFPDILDINVQYVWHYFEEALPEFKQLRACPEHVKTVVVSKVKNFSRIVCKDHVTAKPWYLKPESALLTGIAEGGVFLANGLIDCYVRTFLTAKKCTQRKHLRKFWGTRFYQLRFLCFTPINGSTCKSHLCVVKILELSLLFCTKWSWKCSLRSRCALYVIHRYMPYNHSRRLWITAEPLKM